MAFRRYKANYYFVWGALLFIGLQFVNYDWNIFNFHWFENNHKVRKHIDNF